MCRRYLQPPSSPVERKPAAGARKTSGGGGGGGGGASPAHISRTDGVVAASYFLPVIVTRGAAPGEWSVQWDEENLLSLQVADGEGAAGGGGGGGRRGRHPEGGGGIMKGGEEAS